MTKQYTAKTLDKPFTESIRKATFDQRKSDYFGNMHDRHAVFIELSNKHNDDVRPGKDAQK